MTPKLATTGGLDFGAQAGFKDRSRQLLAEAFGYAGSISLKAGQASQTGILTCEASMRPPTIEFKSCTRHAR